MQIIYVITLLMLSSMTSYSQQDQVKSEGIAALKKCSMLYLNLKKFSLDVEYTVYYNSSDFTKPNDKSTGKIVRNNQNFYQEQFGRITLLNDKYQLALNNNAQVLSIGYRNKNDVIPSQIPMDSLFNTIESVQKIEGGFQFRLNDSEIEKYDILLTSSGYMKKLRTYYRKPINTGEGVFRVISQISYENFTTNPKISSDFFSESNYITVQKSGLVTPKSAYKSYHILNNIDSN